MVSDDNSHWCPLTNQTHSNEPRLYLAQDMMGCELIPFVGGQAAIFTTRCPEKPTINEDAAALIPYGEASGVLVVADGAGGLPSGAKASETAIQATIDTLTQWSGKGLPLRGAIMESIEEANRRVIGLGIGAATTLAIVELSSGACRPYHVGDSQVLCVGGRGKVKLQTMSHSPVGYALEAGMISDSEALSHEERHLVSNLIGSQDMHIDIGSPITMAQRDSVLVASDGLFDNLTPDEITSCLKSQNLASATQTLIKTCQKRMLSSPADHPSKPDDLTVILYRTD